MVKISKNHKLHEPDILVAAALNYCNRGFTPIPLHCPDFVPNPEITKESIKDYNKKHEVSLKVGKEPIYKGWQYTKYESSEEVVEAFKHTCGNLGLLMGNGIIAIDIDTEEGMSWFQEMSKEYDFNCVAKTKQGLHILLRCDEQLKNGKLRYEGEIIGDMRSDGSQIAVSPSIHYSGHVYKWIRFPDHASSIIKVSTIQKLRLQMRETRVTKTMPTLETVSQVSVDKTPISNKVPGLVRKVLFGDTLHFPSRSEAEYYAVRNLITKGWNFQKVYDLFEQHATRNTKFRERGKDYLEQTYLSAQEGLGNGVSSIFDEISLMREFVNANKWSGPNDHAIALAILKIAEQRNYLHNVSISIRQLAELAGVTHMTASRRINTFIKQGYLIRLNIGKCATSSDYSVKFPKGVTYTHASYVCVCNTSEKLSLEELMQHDAFRYRALGKACARLYHWAFDRLSFDVEFAAVALYCSKSKVYNALRKLKKYGLAISVAYGEYTIVSDLELLDIVAEELGSKGTAEKQKLLHEGDRFYYRNGIIRNKSQYHLNRIQSVDYRS